AKTSSTEPPALRLYAERTGRAVCSGFSSIARGRQPLQDGRHSRLRLPHIGRAVVVRLERFGDQKAGGSGQSPDHPIHVDVTLVVGSALTQQARGIGNVGLEDRVAQDVE